MNYRRGIAIASMFSGFVALYLHLSKIGMVGPISCSGQFGCEFVQSSKFGNVMGIDVALIGAAGYAVIFAIATIGTFDRFVNDRRITTALQALIWPAIAFTAYLKYGEFIVLQGFCKWCVVSAVTIVICAILVTLDARRLKAEPNPE